MFTIFPVIVLMEIVTGMFGNAFIAAIYCIDWIKGRKLSSCDMILTCLVLSRILFLVMTWTPVITSMVILAYPSGHSLILILINPKLKQALMRILRSIKCHLKEGIF
ncbi:taste receptor type 2 member 14-like [Emydura macquarii macquarii]|uniref:taste receptor type 2 member 14-like n=1 Tax=Emydura macquarii macquarii TaxID=1129001 RepID=UPI00352B17B4